MGLDMTLYVSDPEIARDIREGYTREGNNWSTVAVSTGRNWREEGKMLTCYFINRLGLGETDLAANLSGVTGVVDADGNRVDLGTLTVTTMSHDVFEEAYEHMDEYVTEASDGQGLIGFWRKAAHIHAWFDRLYKATVGDEGATLPSDICISIPAAVLERLMDDCYMVVKASMDGNYQEMFDLMNEKFPLTGELYEMYAEHEYTPAHVMDLFQTCKFLAHLLSLPGADEALYTYNPWY